MKFEKIPEKNLKEFSGYINNEEKFLNFVNDFKIVGVQWSAPEHLSASYFLRLLQNGSTERARGYGRGHNQINDEYANEMHAYYIGLLDHGALWKLQDGSVMCTAMPYGDCDSINEMFIKMVSELQYPGEIRITFLDDKYRYRGNGDFMIAIYYERSSEQDAPNCSDEELHRKAILHSGIAKTHVTTTQVFQRDRNISEYAKKRANGMCQLCGRPAPFNDRKGNPYLESHHVIRLADGGEDSLYNVVALCPNCHKKMHICDLKEDVEKLLEVARD